MGTPDQLTLGAIYQGNQTCCFRVWAPFVSDLQLHLLGPRERIVPMTASERGYYQITLENVSPGTLYWYRLDGSRERPDPASRSQPQGVHGPSQVVEGEFAWKDQHWPGPALEDYIIYELHTGTYTPEGTFEAILPRLQDLKGLGVTAIELMPIAQFPGTRNWGYDGVNLFAPQNSYGGLLGLKSLVNACHLAGLGVVLDVVYNHLGPEGNYLADFGPYFTDRYKTPWGPALNFDGPESDEVRHFFIQNALYWISEFHLDALRLDAIHAILDHSARPFLQELGESVDQLATKLQRRVYLMPESSLNDTRVIRPRELGGFGLATQWNDDFHHSLRTLLTGDQSGYYQDFGHLWQLAKAYREGYVFSGAYSRFRRRRHGNSSRDLPAEQFLIFSQNHDQVGNRMLGERLGHHVPFEALKLAAGAVLLSPYIPMLFMGEEYGETAPFQYFVSHTDPQLVEAVRRGRQEEFASFSWKGEPPDPQDEATFLRCQLNPHLVKDGQHRVLREFYQELIRLRRTTPALALLSKEHMEVWAESERSVLFFERWSENSQVFVLLYFGKSGRNLPLPLPSGSWSKLLDSSEPRWLGSSGTITSRIDSGGEVVFPLTPFSLLVLGRQESR